MMSVVSSTLTPSFTHTFPQNKKVYHSLICKYIMLPSSPHCWLNWFLWGYSSSSFVMLLLEQPLFAYFVCLKQSLILASNRLCKQPRLQGTEPVGATSRVLGFQVPSTTAQLPDESTLTFPLRFCFGSGSHWNRSVFCQFRLSISYITSSSITQLLIYLQVSYSVKPLMVEEIIPHTHQL